MSKFPFTQASLRTFFEMAKPHAIAWDKTQRGLGCYARSDGGLTLFVQLRVRARQKKKVLGHASEMTLQQARTMAAEYSISGRHGKDVLAEQRQAAKKALTVNDAYLAYTEALTRRGASAGTFQLYESQWKLRLAKHGNRPLNSLTRQELRDWHDGWGRSGCGPTASNNTARMLRTILNHALRKMDADIQLNPATAIEFYAQKNRRPMLALADLPVWAAEVGRIPNANRRCLFLLIAFSGLRRTDAASIRLGDIHDDRLHRPSPKGGPKRKFDVPMTTQLRAIIDTAIEARNMIAPQSDFLFPALRGDGHWNSVNHDEVMGVGCHSLRRFYASACIQAGVDLMYTKSLLNHTTTGDVTMNSYVHLSLAARTEAAQKAADWIETRLMGLSADAAKLIDFKPNEVLEPTLDAAA